MRQMRSWILVAFAVTSMAQAEQTRPLTPNESRGIRLWNVEYESVKQNPSSKSVTFTYTAGFKNETAFELSEIDVQVVLGHGAQVAYRGKPVPLRNFTNVGFGLKGSILPFEKTLDLNHLAITVPSGPWLKGAGANLKICGIRTFSGRQDLYNLGHLYTRMLLFPSSTLSLFKSDPSLLHDLGNDGYDVCSAAWACSSPSVIRYVANHVGAWQPRTTNGITTMHLAALNGNPGVLDLALAHGGDVNAMTYSFRRTPVYKAIRKGYTQNLIWLLKHGADPNEIGLDGRPIAYWAIFDGQGAALHELVRAGADPRHWDGDGWGWMHYATFNPPFMATVRDCGAPVDGSDPRSGFTPLMLSAINGRAEPAIWLLQQGADPTRRSRRGVNAFDLSNVSMYNHSDTWFRTIVANYSRKKRR